MSGACVARYDVEPTSTVDVSSLPAGVYIAVYRSKDDGNAVARRLIKK